MTWVERKLWNKITINGDWVQTTGELRVSESIDQLSRVAEFSLAEQPETEPVEGDTVRVITYDFTDGLMYTSFKGSINAITIESQPWAFTITANDQLRKLDRVRLSTDLDLTGMTPKEAMEAVLGYCGCSFDSADLADPDYILGQEEPLAWQVDTPGSQIAGDLSDVFGCVLMTIGEDRIVWLSHDATPEDDTGSYATFTRGESTGFGGHSRSHGDRSRVQNNWIVRGATIELNENCTAQVWARAEAENAQVGKHRFTAEQSFTSDLIQDESLAEAVVRRLMRWSNRLPDERSTPLINDVNVHPCTKITIMDPTYGMGSPPTYATVISVERQGNLMTLKLAAGPGGAEGDVSTGVDKICNDTHTSLDLPGDFDFPTFDYPDIDEGEVDDGGEDNDGYDDTGGEVSWTGIFTCGIDSIDIADAWIATDGTITDS